MNERKTAVNSGNTRQPATIDANARKFNNTRLLKEVQGQKVRGQGFNVNFFLDVRMMNSFQTKGIKLDKTHRSTRNLIPLDRAGVPDLSVSGIISICGGGDSHDPTTNEQVVAP
jgi:hypothetical protein